VLLLLVLLITVYIVWRVTKSEKRPSRLPFRVCLRQPDSATFVVAPGTGPSYLGGAVRDVKDLASYFRSKGVSVPFDPVKAKSSAEFIALFEQAVDGAVHDAKCIVFGIACHSSEGGALCVSDDDNDPLVRPDDLFRLWARKTPHKDSKVILIIDSCHSGAWVEEAHNSLRNGLHGMDQIAIQATCSAKESAADGFLWCRSFTQAWLSNDTQPFVHFESAPSCFVGWDAASCAACVKLPTGGNFQLFSHDTPSFWRDVLSSAVG